MGYGHRVRTGAPRSAPSAHVGTTRRINSRVCTTSQRCPGSGTAARCTARRASGYFRLGVAGEGKQNGGVAGAADSARAVNPIECRPASCATGRNSAGSPAADRRASRIYPSTRQGRTS